MINREKFETLYPKEEFNKKFKRIFELRFDLDKINCDHKAIEKEIKETFESINKTDEVFIGSNYIEGAYEICKIMLEGK